MFEEKERLKEENFHLRVLEQTHANHINRCLKPNNSLLVDASLQESCKKSKKQSPKKSEGKPPTKYFGENEIKKWVSSEISRLCINENEDPEKQILLDVESSHPLFPIVKMMQSLSQKWQQKRNEIIDLKSQNKSLAYQVEQQKSEIPRNFNTKLQQEKKEIENELNLWLQSSNSNKLSTVIDILNAFGINAKKDNLNETINLKPSLKNPLRNSKAESVHFKENTLEDTTERLDNIILSFRSPRETYREYDNKESCDCDDVYISKSLGFSLLDRNEDSIDQNEKGQSSGDLNHQVCNIQLNELRKYCKQLEDDYHNINRRLQDQNAINQELEHKNVLLESNYGHKCNEISILKKCLKENTEITKELKSILVNTNSTLDLTKSNNENLSRKLIKYKKLLKHKNSEIKSIYNQGITESVVNEIYNEVNGDR